MTVSPGQTPRPSLSLHHGASGHLVPDVLWTGAARGLIVRCPPDDSPFESRIASWNVFFDHIRGA